MITASDIEVLKDVADNVPVTHEILEAYGFVKYVDRYSFGRDVQFKKGGITLLEYRAENNSALVKPYKWCYSCVINVYDRNLDYVIYTVKQLKIFLNCYEETQQLMLQFENELDRIGQTLKSTLLQRHDK